MSSVINNINAGSAAQIIPMRTIVRSLEPDEIERQLSVIDLNDIDHVQLLSPTVETDKIDRISRWQNEVPIDIYVSDPESDFPLLYNFSKLASRHPIRATVSAKAGVFKAAKLALALNFAVKLDVDEPDAETVEEMAEVLEHYLHRSIVAQSVDFFHSLFITFYNNEPADLWSIQEYDPQYFKIIGDDGVEIPGVVKQAERIECAGCEFRDVCKGYFKRSHSDYDCSGVISVLKTIKAAAAELKENVAAASAASGR